MTDERKRITSKKWHWRYWHPTNECNMMYTYTHESHQTCWVEFLFAGAASLLGQGVVGAMDNREANHTVFYSLKTLIHVVLPQSQALHNTAILNTNTHLNSEHKYTFTVSSNFFLQSGYSPELLPVFLFTVYPLGVCASTWCVRYVLSCSIQFLHCCTATPTRLPLSTAIEPRG